MSHFKPKQLSKWALSTKYCVYRHLDGNPLDDLPYDVFRFLHNVNVLEQ